MTNNNKANKFILPLVLAFCISTVLLMAGKNQLLQWGVDTTMVMVGNMLLFAVSLSSLLLYQRAMLHPPLGHPLRPR